MTTIRVATEADAEEILAIYAKYIEQTAITFEYVVPSIEEFRGRIRHTLERFPYLIAEKDGKIAGYAYVSPFKERAAYDWSVETSIYVDMEQKRSGIGRRLYEELENILKQQGILNVNACIAYPQAEDEYLTKDSVLFHENWVIRWLELSISAVISSTAGMTWSGWKNSSESIGKISRISFRFRS